MITRRALITMLGGAAATLPIAARAQQPATPVVGYLHLGSREGSALMVAAFRKGLSEAGYVEGRNVAIEYRWANNESKQLPELANDLVRRRVAVIATAGDPAAIAAKAATASIPIVFVGGNDPVGIGLAESLNRPGGNVTGITTLNVELAAKRLQILHELVPAAKTLAVLLTPFTPAFAVQSRDLLEAAGTLGVALDLLQAGTPEQIDDAFDVLARRRPAAGLQIGASAFFKLRSEQLAVSSVRHALPAIFQTREFVAAGGLVSYASSLADASRINGGYVGRILKGEKPIDLPVQQATKVELILNLKTAKMLGLTVPLSLLGRADEFIE
jgi:putative ABC transport system substrate-binding protein